jgi:hypothetical protein
LSEEIRLVKELLSDSSRALAPVQLPSSSSAAPVSAAPVARKKEPVPVQQQQQSKENPGEDYLPTWAKEGKFSRGGQTVDLKQV